jgi:hypothetical protein
MSIKLLKKLTVATASAALSLAAASLAQSAQAAIVNYSYTGLTPEQSIQGSFSYADDFTGSKVSWNDLTAFTISYNGGAQLDKAAVESLFSDRYLSYLTPDVSSNLGRGDDEDNYKFTQKAGSLNIQLFNSTRTGSLYSYQNVLYATRSDFRGDSQSAIARSSTYNYGTQQSASNGWSASNSPWGSSTYNYDFGKSVAEVGTWLTEKVSGIATPTASCGASPSLARAEL